MFVKRIIHAAFAVIKSFLIDRVQHQQAKDALSKLLKPFEDAANKLTDDNPNNAAQMAEWWEANRATLAGIGLDGVKIWAQRVKDPKLKELLISILDSLDDDGNVRMVAV